jgi:6,7-dimethyl-8-ribityllumazine synthase
VPEGLLRRARVALIRAEYNAEITHSLEEKCLQGLREAEMAETQVDRYSVPGCFEIPLLAQQLAARGQHDAIIALGAVIQGETLHFDLVARECARGAMEVSLRHGVPVIFEVLATKNRRDALRRAGNNRMNKGFEAAQAAVAMLSVLDRLRE